MKSSMSSNLHVAGQIRFQDIANMSRESKQHSKEPLHEAYEATVGKPFTHSFTISPSQPSSTEIAEYKSL